MSNSKKNITAGFISAQNDGLTEPFANDDKEQQRRELAAAGLQSNRIDIKLNTGCEVTALSRSTRDQRLQEHNRQLEENYNAGGLDVDAHPELPFMAGKTDPNYVVLPDSEITASNENLLPPQEREKARDRKRKKQQQINKLAQKNRLRHANRHKFKNAPKPKPQAKPTYKPTTPKPRPQG